MATRHVLAELADAAASAGLPPLEIESVGGVDAARRVAEGEAFDLVFLAADALARLAAEGHVVADTVTALMLSQTAVAVRAGRESPEAAAPAAAAPDRAIAFANATEVQAALRAAARIGISTGPSGAALVRMIDAWGMTGEIAGRLVQAPPGIPVAQLVVDGEVDLAFQQLSEIAGHPGIRVLGVLPDDCAITTVFAGAVASAAADPVGAARVLAQLASDEVSTTKRRHGFDPASACSA